MREVLLIRHAEAVVSSTQPPGAWPLSEVGARGAADLGRRLATRFEGELDRIVASAERKAIETATHIPAGEVEIDARLGEVAKPWYPSAATHERAVARYLSGHAIDEWEPQSEAIPRFDAAVRSFEGSLVAVATHGTVMSLWLADVLTDFDPVAFWLDLRFPDAHLLALGSDGPATSTIERLDGSEPTINRGGRTAHD